MAYQKQTWENLPSQNTPITAERLNHMEDGIEGAWEHGGGGAGDALKIGAIIPFTGTTAPNGYMICDGTAISRTEYAELFSVIGTTFGSGDGSTTFNIPDLQGKVPVGLDSNDTDFDTLGETGGEKEHTLIVDEMPSHNHNLGYSSSRTCSSGSQVSDIGGGATTSNFDTLNTGGDQPHNNLQPYIVINYIIKATEAQTGEVLSETLPVGTEMDFDGETVPTGWEEIDNPEEYSTTEVKTNKIWIDGKPIYRTVIVINQNISGWPFSYTHNIQNIDDITALDGRLTLGSGDSIVFLNLTNCLVGDNFNNVYTIATYVSKTSIDIYTKNRILSGGKIVIEYTKTTD